MSTYGFRLLPRDDAKKIGLPEGSGLFIELYNKMMDEIRKFPKMEKEYGMAPNMMDYEKRISFLNRYFVFQKIATRNVEKLTKSILEHLPNEFEFEDQQTAIAQNAVKEINEENKPKVKNLKKKIKLQDEKEAPKEVEAVKEVEVVKEVAEEEHVLEKKKSPKIKKTKKAVEEADKPEKPEKKKTTRKKKLLGDFEEI
jgi:hypothetical protein